MTKAGRWLRALPWWLLAIVLGGGTALILTLADTDGRETLHVLRLGLAVTLRVTFLSFLLALAIGLVAGLGRVSRRRVVRELATFYVEVVRGFPMLVLLLWIGFALVPWIFQMAMTGLAWLVAHDLALGGLAPALIETCRRPSDCIGMELRGIVGLGVGYGAYVAEVVRAGVESVASGQFEAAASLGMSRRQALRHVVLPQALRLALPPLGNDFISMLKDSALVSVLTVPDIVYRARVHQAKTFQALELWNAVALVYLILTLGLSLGLRRLEGQAHWVEGGSGSGSES
jgi:polar amino acid transport system permease protein